MLSYHRPTTVEEALTAFIRASDTASFHAGGTDLLPRWSKGRLERPQTVVDLKGIAELQGVSRINGQIRIGPCMLLSEIESDPIIRSSAPVLHEAVGRVACPQIRNRATIGGNLCNASPAADTAIPLILLDAVCDLSRLDGGTVEERVVPVAEFFTGPGSTILGSGEILTGIRFTPPSGGWFAAWDKFGTRPAMEIAVASVGLAVHVENGSVADARVGYGSVAPFPLRGRKAEAEIVGRPLTTESVDRCVAAARDEISPITDLRASDAFRREMVETMLRRMLESADRA